MKNFKVFRSFSVFCFFVGSFHVAFSAPKDLKDLIPISDLFSSQHTTGSADFVGHECSYSSILTFRNWEFFFQGKFWCPDLAPFTGIGMSRSAPGAVKEATKDFARKALEKELFTEEELSLWL